MGTGSGRLPLIVFILVAIVVIGAAYFLFLAPR